jgi:hypothetical protein
VAEAELSPPFDFIPDTHSPASRLPRKPLYEAFQGRQRDAPAAANGDGRKLATTDELVGLSLAQPEPLRGLVDAEQAM